MGQQPTKEIDLPQIISVVESMKERANREPEFREILKNTPSETTPKFTGSDEEFEKVLEYLKKENKEKEKAKQDSEPTQGKQIDEGPQITICEMDGPTIDSAKLQSLPRIKYLIGAGIKYIHIRESYCHVIRPKEPVMGWRNYRDLIEDEILVDLFYRVEWYQDEYNISMEKVMDKFKDCENFRGTDSWNRRADQRIEEFKAKVALKYQDLPSARYLLNHGIPVSHVQKIFNQIIKTNPKGPRITTDDYKIKIEDLFLSLIGFDEFENDKSHVEMLIRAARTHRIESEIQKLVHPEDLNQLDYWMETLKRGQKEMECKYSILLEKATPIGDETDGSADKED